MSSSHSHHPRHSQSNSQSLRPTQKTTTPMASPRMPHSVGQPFPPAKMSPAITAADVRTPSPNYFGLTVEPSEDRESARAPHDNWSPPTSSVRSFAAAIPKQLPIDANPEFEAFRRAADASRGKGFALGSSHFAMEPPSSLRPVPPRRPTTEIGNPFEASLSGNSRPLYNKAGSSRMDIDTDNLHDSAYVSSDSKTNSQGSLNGPSFFDIPKYESPAQSESPFQPIRRSNLSKVEDAHPRLSLPHIKANQPTSSNAAARSETLPPTLIEGGPSLMMPAQLEDMIRNKPSKEYLLLDVRVSTHYAAARIKEALNLCIPTTLLKRATFDLQKLQKTLQTEEDQERFAQWRDAKDLIVYDVASAEKRDAHSAMNMFKKFSNEGYTGNTYLLRGGFEAFASSIPSLIDRRSSSERAGVTANSGDGRPTFAPVIGGVMLPTGSDNPNPFFGNIRQNMDLADGVGQMDVAVPPNLSSESLPKWLKKTTATVDHGKAVSDKFLKIERSEQSRMKDAYTAFSSTATQKSNRNRVALSGIEKGGKNRYKDILPFEHARVRLANKKDDNCDYINASHVQASRSNKRYIASQGPLPTTYDDFWSVIWDQDVRVIVMLTAETEGGTLKCHPYWKGRDFGSIKLKPLSEKKVSLDIDKHRTNSVATPRSANSSEQSRRRATITTTSDSTPTPQPSQSESETPYVIIRKFALSHASHPFAPMREITHLHYPSWPDFGAPAQPSHLLALVELANVMQRSAFPLDANVIASSALSDKAAQVNWYDEPEHQSQARPMVVHCSAGCGRTGTFCTVDSVIDMLKRQRLAALGASQSPHGDSDVDMEDPISPMAASKSPAMSRQSTTESSLDSVFKPAIDRSFSESSIDVTDWMKDDSLDLIEHTVEDFRGQRLSMVQSLRQFVLCYETVLEWMLRLQERSNPAMTTRARARSDSLKAMKAAKK
ncbi:hypothetical protein BKA67DRAFT_513742 [Truncatella angustata]|uniref:protein-tyrosine-phosphatase n=1 Tax=Truncatella angustata TaxID=152316 RepID=A0A9P8UQU5_9PEZI|nr:uncharacterized protein BKA67DRAFT_513742 [Truncatella angustata]KAH6656684.1 hypothetical protein BKA67DRAFT_513742 [Truncatella angustata]